MFRPHHPDAFHRGYFPRVSGDVPKTDENETASLLFSPRERGALFRWFQKRATRFSLSESRKFYNKWLVITGRYAVIRLRRNVLRRGAKIEKQSSRIAAVHLLPKNHGNLVMSHLWETQSLGSKRTYSNALADQENASKRLSLWFSIYTEDTNACGMGAKNKYCIQECYSVSALDTNWKDIVLYQKFTLVSSATMCACCLSHGDAPQYPLGFICVTEQLRRLFYW